MKRRIPRWFRFALPPLALGLAPVVLEGASRIVHGGNAPLLPYYFEDGAASLFPRSDITASFYGAPANRYVTDGWGARVAVGGVPEDLLDRGVLVLGDSQALGYSLDFDVTFASQVAGTLLGDPRAARILASPANHPDCYGAVLKRFAPLRRMRPRLAIVTLNLGNDLDEMYAEGLGWSRERQGDVRRWLLGNSFVFMDLQLIKAHRLHVADDSIGVNQILYMLEADERVVLAREAARRIAGLMDSIDSEEKLVVIVPTDIQVDPDEFLKYRRYYSDPERFETLNENRVQYSTMMNALERYISLRLEQGGHRVIRLTSLAKERGDTRGLFMESNHHITALSHSMIARAICEDRAKPFTISNLKH